MTKSVNSSVPCEAAGTRNAESASRGTLSVRGNSFNRELSIEQDDFAEVPPPKFFRLKPGVEVRLRYAYLVTCTGVVKGPQTGAVTEVLANYDPATRGGNTPDGRKVKATLHWLRGGHLPPQLPGGH